MAKSPNKPIPNEEVEIVVEEEVIVEEVVSEEKHHSQPTATSKPKTGEHSTAKKVERKKHFDHDVDQEAHEYKHHDYHEHHAEYEEHEAELNGHHKAEEKHEKVASVNHFDHDVDQEMHEYKEHDYHETHKEYKEHEAIIEGHVKPHEEKVMVEPRKHFDHDVDQEAHENKYHDYHEHHLEYEHHEQHEHQKHGDHITEEEFVAEDTGRKHKKHHSAYNKKLDKSLSDDALQRSETIEEVRETMTFDEDGKPRERQFIKINPVQYDAVGVKALRSIQKRQKQLTSKFSKGILDGNIVTTTNYQPDLSKYIIELNDVRKSYITGDLETPVLKGIDIKLHKADFIVILGPSGSGKTTFLNIISGLDKATEGDVFVLGSNLSLLKDSHLTKFRRWHVGFIFQQYNLLTNLTAKENAEVGENLSRKKNPDMTIDDIFETIGMKDQMNKYPHQMSGGQQQRVSIARALAKNPDILFADEPTGALDEEMGRKVLEILVQVNKRYKTTVIVVTHNPNIAKIGNTVIHIRNGLIDEVIRNEHPADPKSIDWS